LVVSADEIGVWPFDGPGQAIPARSQKAQLSEELVFYCARHDYGTRVLTNTGNLAAVMKTMGHKDVRAAMQYQLPELEIVRCRKWRALKKMHTSFSRLLQQDGR